MKKLFPKTKYGKLSLLFIILMPVLFTAANFFMGFYTNVPAGNSIPEDIVLRPGIALSMLLAITSGIASFFTGTFAVFRHKDKTILVLISTIIGFLLLLFILGEFIPPYH